MPSALLAALLFGSSTPAAFEAPLAQLRPVGWFAPLDVVDVDATLPLPELLQTEGADEGREFAEKVRQRREIGQVHRALGIVSWAAMTPTVILGLIQFYNLYGFGAGPNDNPCAQGNAVFGQEQCWGVPWPHMISAAVTTAFYGVTLGLSIGLLVNDPNEVLTGRGAFSDRIRAHSVLALIHLAGMLAQTFIGVGLANNWFGDRANDYASLQTVAAVHQAIGWTTWAALGAAGALMLF